MMRLLSKLLVFLLFASSAFGQALPIRNDTPTQLRDLGANLNVGKNFTVDQYGQQKMTLSSGGGVASNAVKIEDTPASSGDALVGVAGLINLGLATTAADGDYTYLSLGRYGQQLNTPILDSTLVAGAASALRSEDAVATGGDTVTPVGAVYQTTLTASAADNDYGNLKLNTLGALYSAPVPSNASDGSNSQTAYGSSYISTVSTNSTLATGNILHWVVACNTTAANKYVKFYNSGAPTCGAGTPVLRIVVPPNDCVSPNLSIYGVRMATGIGFCITGGATDADTTNTAAADVYLTIGTR